MLPSRRGATLADLAAVPDTMRAELIDGDLYTQPRPAGPHTRVASILGMDLGTPFDRGRGGPGGWVILFHPELRLGPRPDLLVPDLVGWRVDGFEERLFTVAPDWICEVALPSTRGYDRLTKLRVYARERVAWVWLVDPEARLIEVFELAASGAYSLVGGAQAEPDARLRPFDAVALDLAALWASLPPPREEP